MTEKEERLPTHPLAKHMPSNEWLRDKIESDPDDAEVDVRPSGAYTDAVHEFAMSYESRDPDYTPTDHERALIEDAINSFLADHPARSIDAGDGWELVPADLLTHIGGWEAACKIALDHSEPPTADHDDHSYWQHQLETLANIRAMLAAAPPPAAKEAGHSPKLAEGLRRAKESLDARPPELRGVFKSAAKEAE